MTRLVLDRLWPMLLGLAALLLGALALEEYARRRGNETLVIAIRAGAAGSGEDEEGDTGDDLSAESSPAVNEEHEKARVAARRADFPAALALFEKALQKRPDAAPLHLELGTWLLAAREPKRALERLARAEALSPGVPRVALGLGLARARLGELDGAEQELRRALALRAGYRPAQVALGNVLRRRGRHAEAIEVLTAAASSGGNDERARALASLGAAELVAGRRDDARRTFDRAIEFAPAQAEVRLAVARAWLSTDGREDLSRALEVLRRTVELAPDLAAVHAALGRAEERAGEAAAAEASFERAVRIDPSYRFARRRLLRMALERRDHARARSEAARLLEDAPEVPEHHFLAALVADRDGRDDEARQRYREAARRAGGDYPEAFLNLGLLEKKAGDLARAKAAYDEALRQRPAYPAAWLNLGKLHETAKRADRAEKAYLKALEVDPRYAPAWHALGELHSGAGQHDRAADDYRRALEADPRRYASQLNLAVALGRAGRRDEAIETYRSLVQKHPRYVAAWYDLALALDGAGRRHDAREALARARALDPAHAGSLRKLADLEARDGRVEVARRLYEELLDLEPGSRAARVGLAELAAAAGDRVGCEERVGALLRGAPRDEAAQKLLAKCGTSVAKLERR